MEICNTCAQSERCCTYCYFFFFLSRSFCVSVCLYTQAYTLRPASHHAHSFKKQLSGLMTMRKIDEGEGDQQHPNHTAALRNRAKNIYTQHHYQQQHSRLCDHTCWRYASAVGVFSPSAWVMHLSVHIFHHSHHSLHDTRHLTVAGLAAGLWNELGLQCLNKECVYIRQKEKKRNGGKEKSVTWKKGKEKVSGKRVRKEGTEAKKKFSSSAHLQRLTKSACK